MGIVNSFIHPIISAIGLTIEYIGFVVVLVSVLVALWQFVKRESIDNIRTKLARNVIFGLEFVIAADILLATTANNFYEIIRLGGIVLIRVLLGYALHKEVLNLGKIPK